MSPLACSLLTLTALLAGADAILANPCESVSYEGAASKQVTIKNIPFHSGGGYFRAPKRACEKKYGDDYYTYIQQVTACNDKEGGYKPSIARVGEYSFRLLCDDGCIQGGSVEVRYNCYHKMG